MVQRGLRGTQQAEVSLVEAERDAQKMIERGYRVVSAEQYELPLFGVAYEKVTYERDDATSGGRGAPR